MSVENDHRWEKTNLVTKKDKGGLFDSYQCIVCGKKFKRYGLAWNPPITKCKKPKQK